MHTQSSWHSRAKHLMRTNQNSGKTGVMTEERLAFGAHCEAAATPLANVDARLRKLLLQQHYNLSFHSLDVCQWACLRVCARARVYVYECVPAARARMCVSAPVCVCVFVCVCVCSYPWQCAHAAANVLWCCVLLSPPQSVLNWNSVLVWADFESTAASSSLSCQWNMTIHTETEWKCGLIVCCGCPVGIISCYRVTTEDYQRLPKE